MLFLRQSTASQEVLLGPFLDDTDGKTAETGLTIANTDIQLWKEGATTEANKNSGGATHIAAGRYYAVLDDTDTNTLGKLEINVHVSGALPVRREFMVIPAVVYDSLVLGTDTLTVDVTQIGGDAQSATDLKDFADAGYDPGTNKVQGVVLVDTLTTYTGNTPQTGDNYARLGAPAGASVSADIAAVKAETALIVADTNELQTDWADGGRLDLIVDAILADTGTDGVALASGAIAAATFAANSITASALAADAGTEIATAILDLTDGVESSVTVRQALRGMSSMIVGIISGAGTGTEVFKGIGQASGGTTRVTVTVDASGNRSAMTLNL